MAKHTVDDLRDHLFDTLKALKDKDNPMDLDRAQTVANVAMVVIESAKAEVQMVKAVGGSGSGFIPITKPEALPPPAADTAPRVTVHRLKG